MKKTIIIGIIALVIIIGGVVGEVKCIYKAINCNWEPVGKAEVIYTVSALTGLGSVMGWIDIKDR